MKKALTVVSVLALLILAFNVGWSCGIHHAITRSEIWLSEFTEPEDGQGDWFININIDLDGETWQHTLWIY